MTLRQLKKDNKSDHKYKGGLKYKRDYINRLIHRFSDFSDSP